MTTAVVTGSNRGLGLALCRELKARGHQVVGTCRNLSAELAAIGIEVLDGVDVTDCKAIKRLQDHLGDRHVDLLINNAGITARESFETLELEEVRLQMDVNALGPLRVTRALAGRLRRGAKVVLLASRAGSLASIDSGGRYAYRMSKAAANMAGVILAHDLRPLGVPVLLIYPGYVATAMMHGQGIAPQDSAKQILDRVEALGMPQSGLCYHVNGERLPW